MTEILLFTNTGFDLVNKPLNADAYFNDFDASFNFDVDIITELLTTVRLPLTFEELQTVDYCKIKKDNSRYYYNVDLLNSKMLSQNVAELALVMDAWNSLSSEYELTGSLSRMHVNKLLDTYGAYPLPEEFVPSRLQNLYISPLLGDNGRSKINIVELVQTIGEEDKNKAQVMSPSEATKNDEVLLIPKSSSIEPSQVAITTENSSLLIHQPLSAFYFGGTKFIAEQINLLRQYGMENSILSSYIVSGEYVNAVTEDNKKIKVLNATVKNYNSNVNLTYGNVANKKALYGEYSKVRLMSNCSGESIESNPEDVANGNTITIQICADPRSSGKPVASFKFFKNTNTALTFLNSVNGMSWENQPIIFTEKSGGTLDRLNFETSRRTEIINTGIDVGTNLIMSGAMGGAKAVASSAVDMIPSLLKKFVSMQAEKEIFNRNQVYVQPSVSFAKNESLRDFVGNGFYLIQYQLTQEDLYNYDCYLERFGYNVGSYNFDKSIFENRSNFIYLKFNDVFIENEKNISIKEEAKNELKIGCRFWKTKPSREKMLPGGNP